MKAVRIFHDKGRMPDGSIVEMSIWRLPAREPGRPHGLKYRLYYGIDGRRLVCYDNERGKGDHRHVLGRESSYNFRTAEKLVEDFLADVQAVRDRAARREE